jgi:acetyl esterase/lipase
MVSAAAQRIIAEMRAAAGAPLRSLEEERSGWEAAARAEKLPEGTLVSGVNLNGVDCEWVERADSDREVVVMIHGGGFNSGSPRTTRRFAAEFARESGRRVLVPGYRLAPEDPHPAGLDDIVAVYAALIEDGIDPAAIAFVGDSSGGNLALAAALNLREIGAPQPAALVLISPWLDLTLGGESHRANRAHPNPSVEELQRAASWYAEGLDLRDPLVSPLFGAFDGLPPMLIQAGGHEVLLDDAVALANRAGAAGVRVVLSVGEELWHCFPLYDCPEARAAVEEAAAFVNNAGGADA